MQSLRRAAEAASAHPVERRGEDIVDRRWLILAAEHLQACQNTDAALANLKEATAAFRAVMSPYPTFAECGMRLPNEANPDEIRRCLRWAEDERAEGNTRGGWSPELEKLRSALPIVEEIERKNLTLPEGRHFNISDSAAEAAIAHENECAAAILAFNATTPLGLAVRMRVVERDLLSEIQPDERRTILDVVDQTFRVSGEPGLSLGLTLWDYGNWLINLGYGWRVRYGRAEEYYLNGGFEVPPVVMRCREGLQMRVDRTPGLKAEILRFEAQKAKEEIEKAAEEESA